MQQNKKLSYCDFCMYHVGGSCTAKQNSAYCTKAKNEYWQHVNNQKQPAQKSLRSWDKKR